MNLKGTYIYLPWSWPMIHLYFPIYNLGWHNGVLMEKNNQIPQHALCIIANGTKYTAHTDLLFKDLEMLMIEIIFDVQLFEIVVKGPSLYKTTNCNKRNPQPPQASFMCIPRTAAARDVVRHRIPGLSLQWRHNGDDGVSNHQPHECLLNRLFRCRSKKTKLRVTGLCVGNSPVNFTGTIPCAFPIIPPKYCIS